MSFRTEKKAYYTFKYFFITDTETNGQQITQATVIVSTNGFTNGDTVEENGIGLPLNYIFLNGPVIL